MDSLFEFDPGFYAIAFTGGDVGGKSTLMPIAKKYLESIGMRVAIHAEVASEIISAGFLPSDLRRGNVAFQEYIFSYTLVREELYYLMLKDVDTNAPRVLLCDRGILDSIAYMGNKSFKELANSRGKSVLNLRERYRAVVHMVTAADGAEKFYTKNLENNPGRIKKTISEARELDKRTIEAWAGHPHLSVIDNSTDFPGKIKRAMSALKRVLPMPKALETERKFKVYEGQPPQGSKAVEIIQDYLKSSDGLERRIRKKSSVDSTTYYYTEKRKTEDPATREEEERQISQDEYGNLLRQRDLHTRHIAKIRTTFIHKNRVFEHDVYTSPPRVRGLEIIEVENCGSNEQIEFPPGYRVGEVTGMEMYSNHHIAANKPVI